jgi:hypothetical protein
MPENECYVIIILLHHYPFFPHAINAFSGVKGRVKKTHLNFYSTHSEKKVEKYFNFLETMQNNLKMYRLIHLSLYSGIKKTRNEFNLVVAKC